MIAYTDADFDKLSWHDCSIWGIELRAGDPDEGDWTSDLALDIDFIVDWLCGVGGAAAPLHRCGGEGLGGPQFRVAPATLVFHGVTDPKIDIDWGRAGHQVALQPASIAHIDRAPIKNQKVYLDRIYYRWRILLNCPEPGEIAFGAASFTQTLRADPVLCGDQRLPRRGRA